MNEIELTPIHHKTSSKNDGIENDTKINVLESQVTTLKHTMNDNISKVIDNSIQLDDLENQTDILRVQSKQFKGNASKAKKKMCYRNHKVNVCVSLIGIVVFYYIYEFNS